MQNKVFQGVSGFYELWKMQKESEPGSIDFLLVSEKASLKGNDIMEIHLEPVKKMKRWKDMI